MAVDEGIKKVRIKSEDLPYIQFTTVINTDADREEIADLFYDFRYRIVSADKNKTSAWSTIKRQLMPDVTTPFPYTGPPRIDISSNGNPVIITAIWNHPGLNEPQSEYERIVNRINEYDVWIRWNENNTDDPDDEGWEDWQFRTNVRSNSFNIIKSNTAAKRIDVAIQVPTERKLRDYNNNKLTLFRAISGTI